MLVGIWPLGIILDGLAGNLAWVTDHRAQGPSLGVGILFICRAEMGWDGVGWGGMGCDGLEWNGMGCLVAMMGEIREIRGGVSRGKSQDERICFGAGGHRAGIGIGN